MLLERTLKPGTKCQKLASALREQIDRGILKPGDRLPSLAEMYSQHELSRTTVERVHRLLEQDGLIVREHGRGVFVTTSAARATGVIGFTGYGFQEKPRPRYWTIVQEGIQEVAAREQKSVLLVDYEMGVDCGKVDGMLLADVFMPRTLDMIARWPANWPRVALLTPLPNTASVVADDYLGAQLATEHLLALGHRRIAFMTEYMHPLIRRRLASYRDTLYSAGIEPEARWVRRYGQDGQHFPKFAERAAQVMSQWLRESWHELGCTAILALNDHVAVGIIKALREAGIDVPGDVSVIGFDDNELCEYVTPRLTSIAVPLQEIGATATELLLRQIESGSGPAGATTVLPVRLTVRDSTAPSRN